MRTMILLVFALLWACPNTDRSSYLDEYSCDKLVGRALRQFEALAQITELVLRDPDVLTPGRTLGECIGAQFMLEELLDGCAVHDFDELLPVCKGVTGVHALQLKLFEDAVFKWREHRGI